MRDVAVESKITSKEDWDRAFDQATEVFDAESKFIYNPTPIRWTASTKKMIMISGNGNVRVMLPMRWI
jgi:hypothetical protein